MRLTLSLCSLCIAVSVVCASAPASAQNVSPATRLKLKRIERLFTQLRINPQWERGNIPAAAARRARGDMSRFLRTLNRAIREFNGLAPRSRPAAIANRLNRFGRYHRTVTRALKGKSAAPGTASLSSRTRRALRDLQRLFGRIVLDPQLCAGNIVGREPAARKLAGRIASALSFGKYKLNAVTSAERTDPRIVGWVKIIAANKACAAAIRAGKRNKIANVKAVNKRRREFFMAVRSYRRPMRYVVGLLKNPTKGNVELPQLGDIKAALEAVHGLCTGTYKYVLTDPPSKYSVADEKRPIKWCEASAKRTKLLRLLVTNSVPRRIAGAVNNVQTLTAAIVGDKGWRSGEGITAKFGVASQLKRHSADIVSMYKLIGGTPPANVLKPYIEASAAYWAEVARVASVSRRPRAKGHHSYAERLARRRIKRGGGVSIKTVGLLRRSGIWKIQRSRRRVLSRTLGGFVYYKLRREKLCRVGLFAYKEMAIDRRGRRYQKPPGILFSRMQFVKCR